jgi:hypothetical protein
MSFFKKIKHKDIWKRLFVERFTEPLHLNLISLPVWLFGSYRLKIAFDLIIRQHHAYGLLKAADRALKLGFQSVSVIEFGVASGAGLMNIQQIAAKLQKITGVKFDIYGFDNIAGMSPHKDYRDHPDLYREGDYKMNYDLLTRHLSHNVHIIQGDIKSNIPAFIQNLPPQAPIGFVSLDVDYYSSAVDALAVFDYESYKYLDIIYLYVDDIHKDEHNSRCGERLAIQEFNERHPARLIEKHPFLEAQRIFKHARWLKHIYLLHILDHAHRAAPHSKSAQELENPYLRG